MVRARFRTVAVLSLLAAASIGPAFAAPALATSPDSRHSGRVLDVRNGGRSLVVEEMGPWLGPNTGLETRTMALDPAASIRRLTPTGTWESNSSPGYAVRAASAEDIRVGDFVTVTLGSDGRVATVDIVQAGSAPGLASPSGR